MLYKGTKGVNVAAHLPEGGPAEPGGHTSSSLPLLDNACKHQSEQQINAVGLDAREKRKEKKREVLGLP